MVDPDLLLDTSVVIDLLDGDETLGRLVRVAQLVRVPVIAIGELLGGARHSRRPAENVALIEELATEYGILPCDMDTARHYGEIYAHLRRRGRPISENDMWIAAVAQQHGLALAARDAHYEEVPTLTRIPLSHGIGQRTCLTQSSRGAEKRLLSAPLLLCVRPFFFRRLSGRGGRGPGRSRPTIRRRRGRRCRCRRSRRGA